jgi:hypothetical protein
VGWISVSAIRRSPTIKSGLRLRLTRRTGCGSPVLPDGQISDLPVQPHLQKYSCSRLPQIKSISITVSSHTGAYRDRHGRGAGCGGRGSVGRAMGWQGGFRPVSDQRRADDRCLLRTAKSCGPGAPTLASSLRRHVGPTGLRPAISAGDDGKRARAPGRARYKPLKPLRVGTPGVSGGPVVTMLVCFVSPFAREAAGAAGTRRSPRPVFEAKGSSTTRAHHAAGPRTRIFSWLFEN